VEETAPSRLEGEAQDLYSVGVGRFQDGHRSGNVAASGRLPAQSGDGDGGHLRPLGDILTRDGAPRLEESGAACGGIPVSAAELRSMDTSGAG